MDGVVKEEAEEEHFETALPKERCSKSVENENHLPLAQLSRTPMPNPPSSSSKKRKSVEGTSKRFKIKRGLSETAIKHAASNCGGKSMRDKVSGEAKSPAMIRAQEFQSSLESAFPSFAKLMVKSHVASGFWMGLPQPFCRLHLPKEDATVILEDEGGTKYDTKYIAYKTGLSGGWKKFSAEHKLLEGDVLVFQLVEPTKFKIYITRANHFTEVDGALGLTNLDASTPQNDPEKLMQMGNVDCRTTKKKRAKTLPLAFVQKKKSCQPRQALRRCRPAELSENDSEDVRSEVLEGFRLSEPIVQFRDIKSYADFKVSVGGLSIDSGLSEDTRIKYYRLCCSQKAFLHRDLIKGINYKLIVGTISETVNIADAMKACRLTTPQNEFATWDKTLQAFELLGMDVGFLRSRLSQLVSFAFDSQGAKDTRRYIEARARRAQIEDEVRNLEAKLVEMKDTHERFVSEIENLQSKAESYELKFQEEAAAPW